MLLGVAFATMAGIWSIQHVKRRHPDLSDPQVIVFTEWMGRSPDLVEDQVTYPIVSLAARRAHGRRRCAGSRCSA